MLVTSNYDAKVADFAISMAQDLAKVLSLSLSLCLSVSLSLPLCVCVRLFLLGLDLCLSFFMPDRFYPAVTTVRTLVSPFSRFVF